jgi:hypothetical protein
MRSDDLGKARRVHPHAWLWEPLEADPGFVLSSMFGVKVAYLDSRLVLGFAAKEEPWRGVLVCTEREHQEALRTEFPALSPHPILPKWLYLPESSDAFEGVGERLVDLAARRDPRIGVVPKPKKKRKRTTVVGRARR